MPPATLTIDQADGRRSMRRPPTAQPDPPPHGRLEPAAVAQSPRMTHPVGMFRVAQQQQQQHVFPPPLLAVDAPEDGEEGEEDEEQDEDALAAADAAPRALVNAFPVFNDDNAAQVKKEEVSAAATTSAQYAAASVKPETVASAMSAPSSRPQVVPHVIRRRNVGVPKFLRYLFQILDLEDANIISWAHAGTAFQIRQPEALAAHILPRYFKHNKVSSFQRQLNYFGFKKWTKTQTNVCTFSHPFFLRDDKDKMKLIKRKERANVHAIGPFAAYVLPPGASHPAAFNTSNSTSSASANGSSGNASLLPKPTAIKRQKSSSAAISPRETRPPASFFGSAAAGRRYSTGALPGADGMLGMSVESLFMPSGAASAAPQPSFMAAGLSTAATRKRAAEMGELESNPFQQSGFFFGGGGAGSGSFGVDLARDFGPSARQSQASRASGKRRSLPAVLPPPAVSMAANGFGLQQQQQRQDQRQQRQQQQQQLWSLQQSQQRRKSEQFAPADFAAAIMAQQQQQQHQRQQQAAAAGSASAASLMQTAFQLHNPNPHRQSNIFAPSFSTGGQYQGVSNSSGVMPTAFKFEEVGSSSTSAPPTAIGQSPPATFENIAMLDYNAQTQPNAGYSRPQDATRNVYLIPHHEPQPQQSSVFQQRAAAANPVMQEQQPRDYIDVLLESAALEETMGSTQTSPTTAGGWGEPAFGSPSGSLAPFGMVPQLQQHQHLQHRAPHGL